MKASKLFLIALLIPFLAGCDLIKSQNSHINQTDNNHNQAINNENLTNTPDSISSAKNQFGTITGNISYTTPLYYGLKTCAENITTNETYCTNTYQVTMKEATRSWAYSIHAPIGEYHIYTEDMDGHRGYYTEMSACGLIKDCSPTNNLITVSLKNGETKKDISPLDWGYEFEQDIR